MEFFAVITLQLRESLGTIDAVITLSNVTTRQAIYRSMRELAVEKLGEQFAKATVVFFSVEPNIITD